MNLNVAERLEFNLGLVAYLFDSSLIHLEIVMWNTPRVRLVTRRTRMTQLFCSKYLFLASNETQVAIDLERRSDEGYRSYLNGKSCTRKCILTWDVHTHSRKNERGTKAKVFSVSITKTGGPQRLDGTSQYRIWAWSWETQFWVARPRCFIGCNLMQNLDLMGKMHFSKIPQGPNSQKVKAAWAKAQIGTWYRSLWGHPWILRFLFVRQNARSKMEQASFLFELVLFAWFLLALVWSTIWHLPGCS